MTGFFDAILKRTKSYKDASIGTELATDKKISISNPQSARYTVDGDKGLTATEYEDVYGEKATGAAEKNITQSGRTGMYTGKQLEEAVDDGNISLADTSVQEDEINSTAIEGLTYNPKTGTANVTFVGGGGKEYAFPNVPMEVMQQWMDAPSKGVFYNDVIKQYAVPGFRG